MWHKAESGRAHQNKDDMKALFKSRNLLGDSLQTTPVIEEFCKKYNPEEVVVATKDDYVAVVFDRIRPEVKALRLLPEQVDEEPFDFVFEFDITKAWRIGSLNNLPACVAFGIMLGFDIVPTVPIFNPLQEELDKVAAEALGQPYILFQPYSVSCSSWSGQPSNKRWRDECWAEMYRKITQEMKLAVRVLGGPKSERDYLIPGIEEDDHWFGLPLDRVAALQRYALLVLTLDSGAAHLAASQNANMLELYPACLQSRWMSNLANPRQRIIHALPSSLPVDFVWNYVRSEVIISLGELGLQPA